MAKIMGVRYQQYYKYENGIDRMRCGHLLSIAKKFSLDLNLFLRLPEECIDNSVHDLGRTTEKFKEIEKQKGNNESINTSS